MRIRTLGRHVREGFKNIGRNGWLTVASITSVAITLFALGVFLLLALNINYFVESAEDQVEIRAMVDFEADEEMLQEVESQLESINEVESTRLVPREEGIEDFIASMGEDGVYFEDFRDENNPLPDTFVIQTHHPEDTADVAAQVEEVEHIYRVNYGGDTTDTLFNVTNALRNVGLFLIIGLAFTAMLLISNTIKATIIARRREIEIMKLVGATNSFIRWPFFIEGLLLGIIGALIPISILYVAYYQLSQYMGQLRAYLQIQFIDLLPLHPYVLQMALILLAIGAFIGIWGSMMSIRRFLRV